MALPRLTTEQKMEALEKAQEVRRARKHFKEQLKQRKVSVEEALTNTDPAILGLRVVFSF